MKGIHMKTPGTKIKVGFIGLGRMGSGMAANLLSGGSDLTVYNRTREKTSMLIDQGAKLAASVDEASRKDVAITMLADDNAVESVVFGQAGLMAALPKGAIHVSMGTISMALSEKLSLAHQQAGHFYVSAPVFGRPEAAATRKLFILAAGSDQAVNTCMPLFDMMGQRTIRIGTFQPAANLIKLSGNFLIAVIIESLAEAMALISKAGIDRNSYYELLTSTLFTGPLFENYGKLIADRKFEPAGFAAQLGEKDIRLALAAAEGLGVPMPLASQLHGRFLALLNRRRRAGLVGPGPACG